MPRTRDLAAAAGFAIVVIFGAVFVAEIRAAIAAAFPGHVRTILGGSVVAMIGGRLAIALSRIREHRALRYVALGAALTAGAVVARGMQHGQRRHRRRRVLSLRRIRRPDAVVLSRVAASRRSLGARIAGLAGVLVGTLDEWLQWFVPARVGELHDVVLDAGASACGLLFSLALSPPARFAPALGPRSAMRIGSAAVVVTVAAALFFHTVHLGYDLREPGIGAFRSRYSRVQLESAAKERTARWRGQPPPAAGRLSREDQYVSEALWHVRHRNEAMAGGDVLTAWRENRILETFYAPVLETGTRDSPAGFSWPAEQRVEAARAAGGDGRPYVSDAAPMPIYDWSKATFWMMIALAASVMLAAGASAGRRERPGHRPIPEGTRPPWRDFPDRTC